MELDSPSIHPDFEALHSVLAHEPSELDPRATDSDFSNYIISAMLPLLRGLEVERFEDHFQNFVTHHHQLLARIYKSHDFDLSEGYDDASAWKVIHTPAALLFFERALDGSYFRLVEHFQDHVYEGYDLLNTLLIQVGLVAPMQY
jgi:hypothetical protein